jgi:hypothetical protein
MHLHMNGEVISGIWHTVFGEKDLSRSIFETIGQELRFPHPSPSLPPLLR